MKLTEKQREIIDKNMEYLDNFIEDITGAKRHCHAPKGDFKIIKITDKNGNEETYIANIVNPLKKVEVIEEDKKIENFETYKITDETISGLRKSINELNKDIERKLNEIIDKINKSEE